jgi:hypothetical protein
MKLNLSLIASIISALAGAVGTVLTPIYGSNLSAGVSTVLQSVSGLLVLIAGYHVTAVATTQAKAKIAK